MPAPDVLSTRALNRAYLARQLLLQRAGMSACDALEHLVGVQAQAPEPPYFALWSRLEAFQTTELAHLVAERRVVRVALMRSTIHMVTARDCLALRPVVQRAIGQGLRSSYGRELDGVDPAALVAAGRVLLEERPLTLSELGGALRQRWPERQARALGNAARAWLPLVQVPPRGIWGQSGRAAHAPVETFLDRPLAADSAPDDMILRYLAAFGPASVRDVQAWCGLTRLRPAVEKLRPSLRAFRSEVGTELFDLPDAPRPDADTVAPVRFLAPFDSAILSHGDRTRIVSDANRKRISTRNGMIPGTILVDGLVRGAWKLDRSDDTAVLLIQPYERIAKQDRQDLTAEGHRLLEFAVEEPCQREIRFEA